MAKKDKGVVIIRLKSTESGHMYHTKKNKRNNPNRMELTKYDPYLMKRVLYREEKK
jgi:large subunit ribosomal protein L33